MQTTLLIAAVILAVCTDTAVCIQCFSCVKSDDGLLNLGGLCHTPNFATSVITCGSGVTTCNYLEGTLTYNSFYTTLLEVDSTSNYVFRACGQSFESGSACTPTSITISQGFGNVTGSRYCTCTTNRCDAKLSPGFSGVTPVSFIRSTSTRRTTTTRFIRTTTPRTTTTRFIRTTTPRTTATRFIRTTTPRTTTTRFIRTTTPRTTTTCLIRTTTPRTTTTRFIRTTTPRTTTTRFIRTTTPRTTTTRFIRTTTPRTTTTSFIRTTTPVVTHDDKLQSIINRQTTIPTSSSNKNVAQYAAFLEKDSP